MTINHVEITQPEPLTVEIGMRGGEFVKDGKTYTGTILVNIVAHAEEAYELAKADSQGLLGALSESIAETIDQNLDIDNTNLMMQVNIALEERSADDFDT